MARDTKTILKSSKNIPHSLYAVVPIDLNSGMGLSTFRFIESCFLIMFPSDFKLLNEVCYAVDDDANYFFTARNIYRYSTRRLGKPEGNLLRFHETDPLNVNLFIQLYFQKLSSMSFLQIAIDSYVNSFYQVHHHLAYISLAICIESITKSQTEITHQISRYCAVINSTSKEHGLILYKKVKKLYELRSSIVHGNWKKDGKIEKYYKHLEAVASRTLIELISHTGLNHDLLEDMVNQLGYGEKHLLSSGYIEPQVNKQTHKMLFESFN